MKTSFIAVLVHAFIFAAALYYSGSLDGFQTINDATYKSQMTGSLIGGGFLGFLLALILMFLYNWLKSSSKGSSSYLTSPAPAYAPAPRPPNGR